MRAWRQVGLLAALSGALAAFGFGQSVAEAAKQQQEQQRQGKWPAASRVYTNDDFPSRLPEALPAPSSAEKAPPAAEPNSKAPSAEEVRSAVLTQKTKVRALQARVADLQRQLDEWKNANLGSWCPWGGGYYYNPYQAWCETPQVLSLELNKAQADLAVAQGQLQQMQEEARRMGYRSVVYDPEL